MTETPRTGTAHDALDLDALERVAQAATPGPWITHEMDSIFVGNQADGRTSGLWEIVHMSGGALGDLTDDSAAQHRADAAHIAAFDPPTVLALIEKIRDAAAHDAEVRRQALGPVWAALTRGGQTPAVRVRDAMRVIEDARVDAADPTAHDGCDCPPCPGRGNDGHGMTHCAECCFGTGVEADPDCPTHGERAADPTAHDRAVRAEAWDEGYRAAVVHAVRDEELDFGRNPYRADTIEADQ